MFCARGTSCCNLYLALLLWAYAYSKHIICIWKCAPSVVVVSVYVSPLPSSPTGNSRLEAICSKFRQSQLRESAHPQIRYLFYDLSRDFTSCIRVFRVYLWHFRGTGVLNFQQICIKRATRRPTFARTQVWPMRKIRVSPNYCTKLGLGLSKFGSKYAYAHINYQYLTCFTPTCAHFWPL